MTLHILFVDDQAAVLRSVGKLLERDGHQVTKAGSCADARSLNEPFDVGVFDLNLVDGLGVDLAEEMLADRRLKRVVFFSGTEDRILPAKAAMVRKADVRGLRAALDEEG